MIPLLYEAQIIGFKEGIKAALVLLVFYSFLTVKDRKHFITPFYAGLFMALSVSVLSLFLPHGYGVKENLGNVISMSFALFLIFSAASLFHLSGVNLFGGKAVPDFLKSNAAVHAYVFLATLLFFAPDGAGSMFFLKELSFVRETEFMPYISAASGLCIAAVIFFALVKFYKPYWIGRFFDIPQLLLFLAMVKLLGSGIKGIAELSLLPSVQRGFMKFIHDFVHQTFVFLMVPDHPLLQTTVWDFIAFFFGPHFASIASLCILLFFPFLFIHHSLFTSLPEPDAQRSVQKRKIKAMMLSDRRKKAVPVLIFIVLIVSAWFTQSGETVSQLFIPKPEPVVADRGMITIPLKDPAMNLMDGSLHTFSLLHEGEEIRILIIRKSDNSLSVSLDACEMCPPEGYGQREDHVVCVYCGTPIHIDSLGAAGGCNPIPLEALMDKTFVRIELEEILKKWGFVKPGERKEAVHVR